MTRPGCDHVVLVVDDDPLLGSIAVCLISADGDLPNKAAALGCEFLEKPVLIEQIFDVIERHCPQGR
jgi:FixJ family two-component response regulator